MTSLAECPGQETSIHPFWLAGHNLGSMLIYFIYLEAACGAVDVLWACQQGEGI